MRVKALIALTIPGTSRDPHTFPVLQQLEQLAQKAGCETVWADTVSGWGSLNQDWLHIWCEADTSFGWCVPLFLTLDQQTELRLRCHHGVLLMQVWYDRGIDVETAEERYVPHH